MTQLYHNKNLEIELFENKRNYTDLANEYFISRPNKRNTCFSLQSSKQKTIFDFMKLLYDNSFFAIQRKKSRAMQCIAEGERSLYVI